MIITNNLKFLVQLKSRKKRGGGVNIIILHYIAVPVLNEESIQIFVKL